MKATAAAVNNKEREARRDTLLCTYRWSYSSCDKKGLLHIHMVVERKIGRLILSNELFRRKTMLLVYIVRLVKWTLDIFAVWSSVFLSLTCGWVNTATYARKKSVRRISQLRQTIDSVAAAQLGFCYTRLVDMNCQDKIKEKLSLRDCCCSVNMGKGWSLSEMFCQPCPAPGTGE